MVIERPMPSGSYLNQRTEEENEIRRFSQSISYPKAVYFIISNEFCERFTYYGLGSILSAFLKEHLLIKRPKAIVIIQVFMMFSYCLPLVGALLADCWLNKYRTILIMSPLYAAGFIVLIVSTLPNVPGVAVAMTGLVITYIGLGGVRPCVVALGGDQFILPQQESYLKKYFSVFYFAINAGNFLASIIIPTASEKDCFGRESCYLIGFCILACTISLAAVIFVSGRKFYYIRKPDTNVVFKMVKCICYALRKRVKTEGHWLDKASDRYDPAFISDIKNVLRILVLYIPLPFFRALFDQHGFRWHAQAARMSGDIGKLKLEAEQMNSANSIFILLFIPLFEAFVYPMFARYNFLIKPLQRLTVGGLLSAMAFLLSALVETQLEPTDEYLPRPNEAQLRLFNALTEPLRLEFIQPHFAEEILPGLGVWSKLNIPLKGDGAVKVSYPFNGTTRTEDFPISENTLSSYIITSQDIITIENDEPTKSKDGFPKIMVIYIQSSPVAQVMGYHCEGKDRFIFTKEVPYTEYDEPIDCDGFQLHQNGKVIFRNVELKQGGVYVAFLVETSEGIRSNLLTVTEPNTVHMLWLVPQYALITAGEVMFSITGFEFSFTQAPLSMKATMQAVWLLTAALGKVIVLSAGKTKLFDRLFSEFLLFAGLMTIDMFVFAALAMRYTYVKTAKDDVAGTSADK